MGVDLLDFYRGTLSTRRLWLLIRRLPAESEFIRKARPDIAAEAGFDFQGADMFDLIARAHFQNPTPYPRPHDVLVARERREERNRALEEQSERIRQREEAA